MEKLKEIKQTNNKPTVLTKGQFQIFSKGLEVYSQEDIDHFSVAVFNAARKDSKHKEEILRKAKNDFKQLQRILVFAKGQEGVAERIENWFVKDKNIEKALGNDLEESDNGDDDNNDHDDDDNDELSDEEEHMLNIIGELFNDGETEVTEKEIVEQDGFQDEETHEVVMSLEEKGFIDYDDEMGVTGLTEEGQEYYNASNGGDDNGDENGHEEGDGNGMSRNVNEEEEDDEVNGRKSEMREEEDENEDQMRAPKDMGEEEEEDENGDDNSMMVEADENDDDNQQQQQNGEEEGDDPNQMGQDEGALKMHAKNTPSDQLQNFINDPESDEEHKKVAQEELNSRTNEDGQTTDENEDNEKDFRKWLDEHFDDHDKEDLVDIAKKCLADNPRKVKELKNHFREDYTGKNKGNTHQGKIDKSEFNDFLDEFFANMPDEDLKDYITKLVDKSPKSMSNFKSKYMELKTNKIIE